MRYRSGRITTSRFYQATHMSPHAPSISLLRAVCYPESIIFITTATKYGCEHEKDAVKQYIKNMQGDHNEFSVTPAGSVVSTLKPMYVASPDSFTECSCCGAGVLEVKCPYCVQHTSLEDEVEKSSFCLKKLSNGALKLKQDHQYFYQCQLQLMVTERVHCNFVVWTPSYTAFTLV